MFPGRFIREESGDSFAEGFTDDLCRCSRAKRGGERDDGEKGVEGAVGASHVGASMWITPEYLTVRHRTACRQRIRERQGADSGWGSMNVARALRCGCGAWVVVRCEYLRMHGVPVTKE